ncbi:MAG: glucosyl-3-phosphoglycerate synthase [Armatimonadetes bacterium]|nr:glucosyl-3-phosphoglycerate synthase [Armatimonadota bacterium]
MILLPVPGTDGAALLIQVGVALARVRQARLLILNVVEVPEGTDLSEGALSAQERRQELMRLCRDYEPLIAGIRPVVKVGRQVWPEIAGAARDEGADLILLRWKGHTQTPGQVFGQDLDQILAHPPCDVALISRVDPSGLRRILVPVRGGPNARLALRLADDLAQATGADITVLHVVRDAFEGAERPIEEQAFRQVQGYLEVLAAAGRRPMRKRLALASQVVETILEEAADHQLVILGASAGAEPLGGVPKSLLERLDCGGIVVRSSVPAGVFWPGRPPWSAAAVNKWFAENSFHAREFADLDRLVDLKRRAGVTVSLGLPTLNEEATIGSIIATLRDALMQRVPLLDEIVVIDSGSQDQTVEIARDLDVPVYQHAEILPQHGTFRGKGEALWKSLHVLRGDLVAWVDTDIRNMHPQFVYGLLGPLLTQPRLLYVKGYYRRPIQVGSAVYETGGGRVTELTARPLFNLFFPELSGLIQPLSGEYAGRREALEQVPFFTGYGVEVGLLIDLWQRFGLEAIAQTNLEVRIHRNQALSSLGLQAFAILQVVMQRLEDRGTLRQFRELSPTMKLVRFEENVLGLEIKEGRDHERPPLASLPEHRARRAMVASGTVRQP